MEVGTTIVPQNQYGEDMVMESQFNHTKGEASVVGNTIVKHNGNRYGLLV
jgi:hypothetical protein